MYKRLFDNKSIITILFLSKPTFDPRSHFRSSNLQSLSSIIEVSVWWWVVQARSWCRVTEVVARGYGAWRSPRSLYPAAALYQEHCGSCVRGTSLFLIAVLTYFLEIALTMRPRYRLLDYSATRDWCEQPFKVATTARSRIRPKILLQSSQTIYTRHKL